MHLNVTVDIYVSFHMSCYLKLLENDIKDIISKILELEVRSKTHLQLSLIAIGAAKERKMKIFETNFKSAYYLFTLLLGVRWKCSHMNDYVFLMYIFLNDSPLFSLSHSESAKLSKMSN